MHYYTLALLQSDLLDLDLQAKTRDAFEPQIWEFG